MLERDTGRPSLLWVTCRSLKLRTVSDVEAGAERMLMKSNLCFNSSAFARLTGLDKHSGRENSRKEGKVDFLPQKHYNK